MKLDGIEAGIMSFRVRLVGLDKSETDTGLGHVNSTHFSLLLLLLYCHHVDDERGCAIVLCDTRNWRKSNIRVTRCLQMCDTDAFFECL